VINFLFISEHYQVLVWVVSFREILDHCLNWRFCKCSILSIFFYYIYQRQWSSHK